MNLQGKGGRVKDREEGECDKKEVKEMGELYVFEL